MPMTGKSPKSVCTIVIENMPWAVRAYDAGSTELTANQFQNFEELVKIVLMVILLIDNFDLFGN